MVARIDRARKHELIDIIVISARGVLSGCENWVQIAEYAQERKQRFAKFLKLPGGIASDDTFGRVFSLLEPQSFQKAFFIWLRSVTEISHSQFILIQLSKPVDQMLANQMH